MNTRTSPPSEFTHLSDYETWASLNWLHQNGTLDAQLHARGKLGEEIDELIEALEIGSGEDIISEAGDVLWTSHASGLNTEITVSTSLRTIFPEQFSNESISTIGLDGVALEIYGGVDKDMTIEYLAHYELHLGKAAMQWFNLREKASPDSASFANTYMHLKHGRAIHALANTSLLVSYVAQQFAGSTIQQVMQQNHDKIEHRLANGAAVTKLPRSN